MKSTTSAPYKIACGESTISGGRPIIACGSPATPVIITTKNGTHASRKSDATDIMGCNTTTDKIACGESILSGGRPIIARDIPATPVIITTENGTRASRKSDAADIMGCSTTTDKIECGTPTTIIGKIGFGFLAIPLEGVEGQI